MHSKSSLFHDIFYFNTRPQSNRKRVKLTVKNPYLFFYMTSTKFLKPLNLALIMARINSERNSCSIEYFLAQTRLQSTTLSLIIINGVISVQINVLEGLHWFLALTSLRTFFIYRFIFLVLKKFCQTKPNRIGMTCEIYLRGRNIYFWFFLFHG